MHPDVIYLMDAMREYAGIPCIIHEAYAASGHSPKSYHYKGLAIDFHFEGLSLLEQFLISQRFAWGGIGLYPFWARPGLHVDMRPLGLFQPGARWWRDEKGVYRALTAEDLKSLWA